MTATTTAKSPPKTTTKKTKGALVARVGKKDDAGEKPPQPFGRRVFRVSLKVARPYFWLISVWTYVLPTGMQGDLLWRLRYWVGVAYSTYPANLLVYLMNDLADVEVDALNPRKNSSADFGTGAKERLATLQAVKPLAGLIQIPFLAYFCLYINPLWVALWFGTTYTINWSYNYGPHFSSNYPPMDLLVPGGYMGFAPLSVMLNGTEPVNLRSWIHMYVFVVRGQFWMQTFDIEPDAAAGRRTTAVVLGRWGSYAVLALMLVLENIFVVYCFSSIHLRLFSAGSFLILLAQVVTDYRRGVPITIQSIKTTFLCFGLAGFGLMVQTWRTGSFADAGSSGRCS